MEKKISDFVKRKSYEPCIDLNMIEEEEKNRYLNETFIVTEEVANLTKKILRAALKKTYNQGYSSYTSHFIIAEYGKGKSRFLVSLINLFREKTSDINLNLIKQIERIDKELLSLINELNEENFIVAYKNTTEVPNTMDLANLIYNLLKTNAQLRDVDLKIKSPLEKAINILTKMKDDQYIANKKRFEENYGETIDYAIRELRKNNFEEYYRIIEILDQTLLDGYKEGILDIKKFVEELDIILERENKKLVILLDEFTYYLVKLNKNTRKQTIFQIQDFAEKINKKKNITLIASMHKHIEKVFDEQEEIKDEIEKVKGRYQIHTDLSKINLEDIVKSILDVDQLIIKEFEKFPEQRMQLSQILSSYGMKLENLFKLFPFHPATIFYLTYLSSFSNQNRTALLFVDKMLRDFQEQPLVSVISGKINLIKPDSLWNYFHEEIKEREDAIAIAHSDLLKYVDNNEHIRIIADILAVIRAASTINQAIKPGLSIEKLSILSSFDENMVDDAINALLYSDYLYKDEFTNTYELRLENYASVSKIFTEKMKELGEWNDWARYFGDIIKLERLKPINEIKWKRDWNDIQLVYFNQNLENIMRNNKKRHLNIFILIEKQWTQCKESYYRLTRDEDINNTIILVIKKQLDEKIIKQYISYKLLTDEYRRKENKTYEALKKKLKIAEMKFNEHMDDVLSFEQFLIISPTEEYTPNSLKPIIRANYLNESIETAIEIVGKECIKNQFFKMLNLDEDPEQSVSNVRSWLNDILTTIGEEYEFNIDKVRGQGKTVIKQHFESLGLAVKNKNIFTAKLPIKKEDSVGFEITKTIKDIATRNFEQRSKQDVLEDLNEQYWRKYSQKPYGLNDNLLSLYLVWTAWIESFILEKKEGNQIIQYDFTSHADISSNKKFINDLIKGKGKDFYIVKTEKLPKDLIDFLNEVNDATIGLNITFQTDNDLNIFTDHLRIYLSNKIRKLLETLNEKYSSLEKVIEKDWDNYRITLEEVLSEIDKETSNQSFLTNSLRKIVQKIFLINEDQDFKSFIAKLEQFQSINDTFTYNFQHLERWEKTAKDLERENNKMELDTVKEIIKRIMSLSIKDFLNPEFKQIFKDTLLTYQEDYNIIHRKLVEKSSSFMKGYEQFFDFELLKCLEKTLQEKNLPSQKIIKKIKEIRSLCDNQKEIEGDELKCLKCSKSLQELNDIVNTFNEKATEIEQEIKDQIIYLSKEIKIQIGEIPLSVFDSENIEVKDFMEFKSKITEISEQGTDKCIRKDLDLVKKMMDFVTNYLKDKGTNIKQLISYEDFKNEFEEKIEEKLRKTQTNTIPVSQLKTLISESLNEIINSRNIKEIRKSD